VRLVTVRTADGNRAARIDGDTLVYLDAPDVGAFLARADWREEGGSGGERVPLAGAELGPVVPAPEKIFCVGLNYRSHIEENGVEVPAYPTLFAKFARALIGPRDEILLPANSSRVDWEGELGVVIGRTSRRLDESHAAAAIAGYTVVNDISMRDWQARTQQWLQGKTFEASTPVGPSLVTLDEFDDPDDLRLTCEVGGTLMQETTTSDLVFSPAALVAYISNIITLVPGDLILTGTPGGIGGRMDPPRFLTQGEVVRTAIAGIGELVNTCTAEAGRGA
jgi:acylpyruvate hydrolase